MMPKTERPDWLTVKAPDAQNLEQMKALLEAGHLNTVCEGADCPNMGECFANKTCTFMILGPICTRNCHFCAVEHGRPVEVDLLEPQNLALTAKELRLKHIVVTSVTRDDLSDGGAGHFAATINAIRREAAGAAVEVLIPDFKGNEDALRQVIDAGPDVINHNIETVPRLYPAVRPQARYERSLQLLRRVAENSPGIVSKSGLMLGLGETFDEVIRTMRDLRQVQCDILTLGQYLQPTPRHYAVAEYIHPHTFNLLQQVAYEMGFLEVNSGPLVRSSYRAAYALSMIKAQKIKKGVINSGQNRQI